MTIDKSRRGGHACCQESEASISDSEVCMVLALPSHLLEMSV